MSQVISVVLRNASAARVFVLSTTLVMSVGCAQQSQQRIAQQDKQIQSLQARLDEAERTNGRLNVRIEELEDDVFLLQDRVDANRIALQRRGIMGPRAQANNYQKPAPSPQTYWSDTPSNNPYVSQEADREYTRIPLGGGDDRDWRVEGEAHDNRGQAAPAQQADSDLVITEKEFNAFAQQYDKPSGSGGATGSKSSKAAQPNVTEERLPTTQELDGGPAPEQAAAKPAPSRKDALGAYKDALAEYRSGNYREALGGFETFLASNPQPDYLDNALYWIGECHFGLGQYEDAVSFFTRVMQEQPDGNKVPDAMLKMSIAFDRVGRGADATRLLEDLNRQYPATNAGRLASQKLADRK